MTHTATMTNSSTTHTKKSKVDQFRFIFESSLSAIHKRTGGEEATAKSKRCIILSGGVDTCAIIAASKKIGLSYAGALTVVTGDESPDLGFSSACAKEHGLEHHIVRLRPDELVEQFLPDVIKKLKIYNGMLVRNSLVIAAVFKKAAELGFTDAIVGDGADELFGGYSFMWGYEDNPAEWREKRDSMCAQWTFSTEELAMMYNMRQHSPYTEPATVEWAIANTEREDCVGVRPIRLFYGEETQDHTTGKVILREAYETVSSWRRKDPIEMGSGATVIGHDTYWRDYISDEEFERETSELLKRGYRIDRKEQLANYRVFAKCFGFDGENGADMKRLPLGEGCVDCCFDVGDKMFCHMCGAYPAPRNKAATHNYDFDLKKLVAREDREVDEK
jgi:asparagine synthase (glutamine-hydrolysing)